MERVPSNAEDVYVHKYVERSSSDILRVLHATAKKEEPVPSHSLIDDTYLLPRRHSSVIRHHMSLESGRNAARWIRDTNPDLFQQTLADPPCQVYYPRLTLNADTTIDMNTLITLIQQLNVSDAITAYKKLKNTDTKVPSEVLHELLDLLCFFNAEDDVPEQNHFERSYVTDKHVSKWRNNGVAEEVFNNIKPPTARAYCTLIKGMYRHNQIERGGKYWQEMQNARLPADADTFHAVISNVFNRVKSSESCWQDLQSLLTDMCRLGISPSLATLNSCLQALRVAISWPGVRQAALDIWCEMTRAGVVPSLGSYALLIQIYYDSKSSYEMPDLVHTVLDRLEGQSFSPRHISDLKFFVVTARCIRKDLQDPELTMRLETLLNTGDNFDLIGTKNSLDTYYRTVLSMMAEMLDPTDFMENHYRRIVPYSYTPEPNIMKYILEYLSVGTEGARYYPELWADCIHMDLVRSAILAQQLLQCLVDAVRCFPALGSITPDSCESSGPPLESASAISSETLRSELIEIGWDMFKLNELSPDRPQNLKFAWTASMLGDVLYLQCSAGHFDRAKQIFTVLDARQTSIVGVCPVESLQDFHQLAVNNNDMNFAVKCVMYASSFGFPEASTMADTLLIAGDLSVSDKQQLSSAGLC